MDDMDAFLFVENDPGLPLGETTDPFAGLDAPAAEILESLTEGKAVGTAQLGGDVGERDRRLRHQVRANVRYHVKQAGVNAMREMKPAVSEARRDIGSLLRGYLRGTVSFRKLQEESAAHWMIAYSKMRDIGRKASGVERFTPAPETLAEEERWFRSAVREELSYWQLFMDEVRRQKRSGVLEENEKARDRVWQRFDNYIKALRFMYESARIVALPPQTLLYWMGPKPPDQDPKQEGRICPGCIYMMERSPFTKENIPAVPRDGSTSCLTNCRHRIVMRVAHPIDVQKRAQDLPKRKMMVESLKRIKEADHGLGRKRRARSLAKRLARQRPQAQNPFKGRRMPKNPTIPPASVMPPLADERTRSRAARRRHGLTEGRRRKLGITEVRRFKITKKIRKTFPRRAAALWGRGDFEELHDDDVDIYVLTKYEADESDIMDKVAQESGDEVNSIAFVDGDEDDDWAVWAVRWLTADRELGGAAGHGGFVEAYLSGVPAGAILEGFAPEASAFRTIDLYYIAKMLAQAVRQRPLRKGYIEDLLDRLVAALELTVLGVRGRADALHFSNLIRGAMEELWDALSEAGVMTESAQVIAAMVGEDV